MLADLKSHWTLMIQVYNINQTNVTSLLLFCKRFMEFLWFNGTLV